MYYQRAACTGTHAVSTLLSHVAHIPCLALQTQVRQSLISATAAASLVSCFLMGALANLPLALAPGMGINAYFTYSVVGFLGTGMVSTPPLTREPCQHCAAHQQAAGSAGKACIGSLPIKELN